MGNIKVGIIGMGNMGSKYALMLKEGKIPGLELRAVTRVRPERFSVYEGLMVYHSGEELLAAVKAGELVLDGVIIATPHYDHQRQAIEAMRLGLHVLCDKPAGVYSRQGREIVQEAQRHEELVYAMIFNQRTNPIYQKVKELVESRVYGKLKRVNWIVTDWYRPEAYYSTSSWRATWEKDGGGTLLNQCPHNLDLLQWICGMPVRVQGFCHEGKYHNIEVEDEVTAYLEFEGGATGIFFASTGEAPGINRLEISLEDALAVCEKGELRVCELGFHEAEYRRTADDFFKKLNGQWKTVTCEGENTQYIGVLTNFAAAVQGKEALLVSGSEGNKSLILSNGIYLSSWQRRMVELPKAGTDYEREFEQMFEQELQRKIKGD